MNHKVSVIIPIYKVEKQLHRCINSIIQQTYKNVEIILVNDGSPDNCGKIADDYAQLDPRIKVFHKENGGLSDARNYGMTFVTGKFTLFVDSDDWLDINSIKEMVNMGDKYDVDVVQSSYYYAYNDYLLYDNRYYSIEHPPILLDNRTLMLELIRNEKVKNFAWGKLYKTSLIKDIPFKKGVLFEDVFWAHKVMHKVNRYLILHKPMYFYMQRKDSIVANFSSRNLDMIKGLKERHDFIEAFYKELTFESYKVILKTSLIHYNLLLKYREKDRGSLLRKEINDYIKEHFQQLKKSVENDKQLRRQLLLFSIHPYFNVVFLLVKRLMRKLKLLSHPKGLKRIDL